MTPYNYAISLLPVIRSRIDGTIAGEPSFYGMLGEIVSIDGGHVEIGSFYGVSAIVACMVKREYGKAGEVICIDPFVYSKVRTPMPSAVLLRKNLGAFGCDAHVIEKSSKEVDPIRCTTALIDGNHTKGYPYNDFLKTKSATWHVWHDYCDDFPAVAEAVEKSGRKIVALEGKTCVTIKP